MEKDIILAIDDTVFNLEVLEAFLGSKDFQVETARSGAAALQHLESGPVPDLILLDIMMPGMNGIEVCKKLKATDRWCEIPIIFLSALSATEHKLQCFQVGGSDYVTKPFILEEVLARVNCHLSLARSKKAISLKNDQMKKLNKSLKKSISNKDEILRVVARDLKNPLNTIVGMTQLATEFPDQKLDYWKHIEAGTEHMLDIIEKLLLSDKIETVNLDCNPEFVNLADFVQKELSHLVDVKHIKHKITLGRFEECTVLVDPLHLKQIFDNFISNARKFSDYSTGIEVGIMVEDYNVTLYVSDEGPGLSDNDLEHIFGKYQRLSAQPKHGESSTGLGLSIVKSLAELNQGHVSAVNNTGKGCTFSLYLKNETDHPSL